MSKGPKNYHIVPNPAEEGDVKRGDAGRASGHHGTKHEAIDSGRSISRSQGTELRIRNKDGRIASSDSHGRDSHSPTG